MAEEYIKREDAIEGIKNRVTFRGVDSFICDAMSQACCSVIRFIPSADVAPVVHGEWIVLDDGWEFEEVKCSSCGCVEYFNKGWKKFNYCPNCGATMDMDGTE